MSKYNNRWKCEEIIAAHVLQSVSRCMNVFGHIVSDRKLVVERIGRVAQSFRREEDGPADFSISRVASKARSAPNFISDAFASKWITGSEENRRIYRDPRNRVVESIKLAWPDLKPYLKHAGWFDERNWPQDQVNVMIDLRNLVGSHGREYSWIYLAQHMEAKAAEMGLERRKYSGEAVEDNYLASKEDYDMFSPLDPDRFKPDARRKEDYDMFSPLDPDRFKPDARRKEIDLNKPQDKWDPVTMGCTPDFYPNTTSSATAAGSNASTETGPYYGEWHDPSGENYAYN
ncbi:hypothetical protein HYALB_00012902 [Hymenoscyphus albidus]|uniref:Uncharacterized protein n=1 Tax=Hymenoscyphus albidus TaxID=595503 RepID=A0A9N9Q9R6_9HELO|nr:hypothetical protein HYALB_00012902 [Hymenoscyphus albidus]